MMFERIKKIFTIFRRNEIGMKVNAPIWECSISSCDRVTSTPRHDDPRLRWMIAVNLKDEEDQIVCLNLCPDHVREFFPEANEDFYKTLEYTEKMIREHNAACQKTGYLQ